MVLALYWRLIEDSTKETDTVEIIAHILLLA